MSGYKVTVDVEKKDKLRKVEVLLSNDSETNRSSTFFCASNYGYYVDGNCTDFYLEMGCGLSGFQVERLNIKQLDQLIDGLTQLRDAMSENMKDKQ